MEDVAIIGAGPYGLSIAAHLAAAGVKHRIFGKAMNTWRTQMPQDMRLKSEGFASTLFDPKNEFPLSRYCQEQGVPYADVGLPVECRTFTKYGEAFAERFAPGLEDHTLVDLAQGNAGFELTMDDGEQVQARNVICAIGISHYAYTARTFSQMPAHLLSHSSTHQDFTAFKGRRVAVIGAGASATDCAALLSTAGATTHLLTRRHAVEFHNPPSSRNLRERLRSPRCDIGTGWRAMFFSRAPMVFHAMPAPYRVRTTREYAGPSACWFVRQQVEQGVTTHTGVQIDKVTAVGDHAVISFEGMHRNPLEVDHIVVATGYRVDMSRLAFLNNPVRQRLRTVSGAPALSQSFESNIPVCFLSAPRRRILLVRCSALHVAPNLPPAG